MAESTVSLNLFIDTQGKRVLYAEAAKDFVDFLFNVLCQSVGTVIGLTPNPEAAAGSLVSLYKSINELNESYFLQKHIKDTALTPAAHRSGFDVPLLALNYTPTAKTYYRCSVSYCANQHVSDVSGLVCPYCKGIMSVTMRYLSPPTTTRSNGFVKGMVTYMVMDDLSVMPLSTKSTITLLKEFNVKNVNAVEEKVVSVGKDEAVKLLTAAFHSKTVLTHVFLKGTTGTLQPIISKLGLPSKLGLGLMGLL
ncbi:hypothetical protein Salat_0456700 [Sesamum alatum]|uniref:DUF674 domain-containing protein n=1 Tax=Sesamum alatum TaxID=300844 RepID=A0AAE1Z4A7_9LAMI|nr:hypothetical protein Salat_0456700 [Sesamum alatum]